MPRTPLAVSPEHANQNNRSVPSYIDALWNEGRSAWISHDPTLVRPIARQIIETKLYLGCDP
jgi:hypothetical protein